MQNIKKLLALMLMIASVLFIACSEDDEPEKLTKEEAKTEITQLSTDISAKLAEMNEVQGMVALESLMAMPYPFTTGTKSTKSSAVLNNVQKYLLPYNYLKKSTEKSVFEAEPFDFHFWAGTYTWDAEHQVWVIVFDEDHDVTNDKIIISFPTEGSTTNNAVLTMNSYEEQLVDEDYLPTDIDVNLYLGDIKVIDIVLTATWDMYGEPTALDVSAYLIPFEFIGTYNNTNTAANIDFAIKYEDAQFFSTGVGATWAMTGDSIPSNINGYLQFFHVKFQADVDLAEIVILLDDFFTGSVIYISQEELIAAINKKIDAYVTVSGTWAADIEIALVPSIVIGEDDNIDILFVYADGTSESAIPYFEDIGVEIDEFFGDLDEYYIGW